MKMFASKGERAALEADGWTWTGELFYGGLYTLEKPDPAPLQPIIEPTIPAALEPIRAKSKAGKE